MKKLFIFLSLMFFNSFVLSNTDFKDQYLKIVSPEIEHPDISRDTKEDVIRLLSKYEVPCLIKETIPLLEKFDDDDRSVVSELCSKLAILRVIVWDKNDPNEKKIALEVSIDELVYHAILKQFYEEWRQAAGLESNLLTDTDGNQSKDLVDSMNWAVTKYPAKKHALVLWNHDKF